MHRCYVSPAGWSGSSLTLSPEEQHYLLDVLRAREGDEVTVFDGQGRQALAEVRVSETPGGGGRRATLVLRAAARAPRPPALPITLLQALPKGARMDWIVEKAVELGVAALVPVLTERVVRRLDERQRTEKAERWRRVARAAARQCGAAAVPEVREVADLPAALAAGAQAELFLVGSLAPDARPLRAALRERAAAGRPRSVALLIGPEGDLTPAELRAAQAAGAQPVSFGAPVLRVETAALFGLSVLVYEWAAE